MMEGIECRNVRKAVVDGRACGLPQRDALNMLKPGDCLRLSLVSGEHFWCELVSRSGKSLVVKSLDTLPCGLLRVGDEFATSTGAVFRAF